MDHLLRLLDSVPVFSAFLLLEFVHISLSHWNVLLLLPSVYITSILQGMYKSHCSHKVFPGLTRPSWSHQQLLGILSLIFQ